jgi:hypothetical protein
VFAAERRPPASEHSRTRPEFRSNNRRALDDFYNLARLLKKPADTVAGKWSSATAACLPRSNHDLVTYATVPAVLTCGLLSDLCAVGVARRACRAGNSAPR